jgi:hypothetical protein
MNALEKYAFDITREFVPEVEKQVKEQHMYDCILKSVPCKDMPKC